jgi:hypothetical protein
LYIIYDTQLMVGGSHKVRFGVFIDGIQKFSSILIFKFC